MKVLHLPQAVAGNPWSLSRGERELGLESDVLHSSSDRYCRQADIYLHCEKYGLNYPATIYKLLKTFMTIRNRYDVFHFNYGSSLANFQNIGLYHLELPFYPDSKKLFVTYNGCDARQKYQIMKLQEISACASPDCYGGICNSGKRDIIKKKSILKMSLYVKHMWAVNPDLLHFLPPEKSSFLPYASYSEYKNIPSTDFSKRKLKIVHAPTNRACKGSDIIIGIIKELEETHKDFFSFELIENIKYDDAVQKYKESDLVIDQILIGWYGGFAVELMSMGKPVISRIEESTLKFIPDQMKNELADAVINASPDNLKETLLRCIEDRQFLKNHAEAGLNYAKKWHSPSYVASITKAAYEQ